MPHHPEAATRVPVSKEQYVEYWTNGFIIFRGLVPAVDVAELVDYTDRLMRERSEAERGDTTTATGQYLAIEFLHRESEIHERFLLHPNVLDVIEALIGPDILAVQDMLFLKGPGAGGEGHHQDAYSVPTAPETLIGAWMAIDRADEDNGCLWMATGSHAEPVHPGTGAIRGARRSMVLSDIRELDGLSNPTPGRNDLAVVAERYPAVPAVMDPGDVAFFGGRFIHWSGPNRSPDRTRRAFVGHYCDARSAVLWDHDAPDTEEIMNERHILARGTTHYAHATPRFSKADGERR